MCPFWSLCNMTQFQILCKLVQRHSYTPGNLYPDGKNCAVPVSHRDYFPARTTDVVQSGGVAKDEAQWPMLRQVTPTKFYCRAVSKNEPAQTLIGLAPPLVSFAIKWLSCFILIEVLTLSVNPDRFQYKLNPFLSVRSRRQPIFLFCNRMIHFC